MNFILGRGLAGKPIDQQLSINAIYKGITSVNDGKSDKEVILGQTATTTGTLVGSGLETILDKIGFKGESKQIISNAISGYIENKIENPSEDKKETNKGK